MARERDERDMLNYTFKEYKGSKVLELSGTLTSSTIESFRDIVINVVERENLIINMESITFITSSGMNTIIDLSIFAKENGRRIIILWPGEDLMKMAEEFGVYHHLIFADSLDLAAMKIKYFT
ncbi:MAG: STAS domain-containing protein [Spirochaetes bacterium]|nr:STAS domain-containing protein [Spirochaetota bacterium]